MQLPYGSCDDGNFRYVTFQDGPDKSGKRGKLLLPRRVTTPDHSDRARGPPWLQGARHDLFIRKRFRPDIKGRQEGMAHPHPDHLAQRIETGAFVIKRQIGAVLFTQIANLIVQPVTWFKRQNVFSL